MTKIAKRVRAWFRRPVPERPEEAVPLNENELENSEAPKTEPVVESPPEPVAAVEAAAAAEPPVEAAALPESEPVLEPVELELVPVQPEEPEAPVEAAPAEPDPAQPELLVEEAAPVEEPVVAFAAEETPAEEPAAEFAAEETPAADLAAEETPAADLAAEETPAEEPPAEEPEELSLDEEEAPVLEVPGEVEKPKKEEPPPPPIHWDSATEAILLAADKPVSIERLKEVFGEEGPPAEEIEKILERIALRHSGVESGITLRKSLGGWQFATRAENAKFVQLFLATKPFRLGKSALETLSIVAYRQPVTRAEIDQVRGIDSSHLLRVLMERGLVRMAGKADLPGRPVQYGTTPKFLETVGLPSLADLPPLSELEQLKGDTPDPIKELEAGLDRFIQETPTPKEISLQATDGLPEIDALIEKAEEAPKEVYGSPEAQEVAQANQEALLAYQESAKKVRSARRKKTITFDELTGAAPAAEEPLPEVQAPSEEPPPEATP